MDIHEIKLLPNSENLKYKYDGKKLNINLGKLYTRKDTFTLSIHYTAKPNELTKGGSKAITSDVGLYFINPLGKEADKPRQIWTQGETEASSCWFPTIDSPNEKTTQEMFITIDTNFTVLSNGKFISSKNNLNGTKTDYWKQSLPHAPYLFMMAIGEYAVVKDKWKDIEVNYYVEPNYKKYAKWRFSHM
jgi:aminopeptidase N